MRPIEASVTIRRYYSRYSEFTIKSFNETKEYLVFKNCDCTDYYLGSFPLFRQAYKYVQELILDDNRR